MHRSRRIRVAHILEATVGGTREHVLQIFRGLDARRFDLALICSVRRDPGFLSDVEALRARGHEVVIVPMVRAIRPLSDLAAFARLVWHFARRRYDIVHTHSSKAGFLGRLAAWTAGCRRIVHTGHIFYFQWRPDAWAGRLYRALEWLAARVSRRIVALSDEQRDLLVRTGVARPDQVVVIPNGVRINEWSSLPRRAAARRRLGLPEKGLLVGMAARLAPQKGCRHFVRAARLVAHRRPDVRFALVGEGDIGEDLVRLAADLGLGDRFRWLGHCDDMRAFYAALDVFVLSSLWEGMPYVVLEAMACGRPVCATGIPGVREVIRHGETGLLSPAEDDAALAENILALLDDAPRRRAMGRAARALAAEGFSSEAFLWRLACLYSDLVEEGARV